MAIGAHSRSWVTTLTLPQGGDLASDLDTIGQLINRDVDERLKAEHTMGQGLAIDGQHYENSARVGFGTIALQPPDPSVTPQTGARDVAALPPAAYAPAGGGNEGGRGYYATDTGELYISDGVDWRRIEALSGNIASNEIDLLTGVQFLIAGADAMDLHLHEPRHTLLTAGAAGAEHDYLTNLINAFSYVTAASVSMTLPATPVALLTRTIDTDTPTRRGTSHALVIAMLYGDSTAGAGVTGIGEVWLDLATVEIAQTRKRIYMNTVNAIHVPAALLHYATGLAAGVTHSFRLMGDTDAGLDWDATNVQMLVIDLGLE